MHATNSAILQRRTFSDLKLRLIEGLLRKEISSINIRNFSIYAVGSYARGEASENSDIDLFFLVNCDRKKVKNINTEQIRLMSRIIDIGQQLELPSFSNDGEYLKLIFITDMLHNLGGRLDDYENHFTARMLLMLEAKPLYGHEEFDRILGQIIGRYFSDYKHHPHDFRPIFLINDIVRFWKTLCLNYENKRNKRDPQKKLQQKIKNFKLKFSRMMTCYSAIIAICAQAQSISPEDVRNIFRMRPLDRLLKLQDDFKETSAYINEIVSQYSWFLDQTKLTTQELEVRFSDSNYAKEAFHKADVFSDLLFGVLKEIDKRNGILKYLVI